LFFVSILTDIYQIKKKHRKKSNFKNEFKLKMALEEKGNPSGNIPNKLNGKAELGKPTRLEKPTRVEKPTPSRVEKPASNRQDKTSNLAKTTNLTKSNRLDKSANVEKSMNVKKLANLEKAVGTQPGRDKTSEKPVRIGKATRGGKLSRLGKKLRLEKQRKLRVLRRKVLKMGDRCILRISACGPNGIGIDEYSYPYSIFVPNSNLGDRVKAKIVKLNLKENKYAIARGIKTLKKGTGISKLPIKPGEKLTINIEKVTRKKTGIVTLGKGYKLIIPKAIKGANINVVVTRLKSNYAFGKVVLSELAKDPKATSRSLKSLSKSSTLVKSNSLLENSKYTLVLPKTGVYLRRYVIVKLNGSLVFIRFGLGAKPGNKVRIKITKVNEKFALAKIIQINPVSLFKKRILVQHNIRQMIKNGMHLGERAIKCNARMKNYIWLKKQTTRLEPKNRPLIKQDRHIINLLKTRRCLNKSLIQLSKYALKGRTFLFIGTKKAAAGLIARASIFSKTSFFVNTRWLGGMLTNWKTILKSISKIRPILKEKQQIIGDILAIRESIKQRLIRRALLLKKKSNLFITKSRFLTNQFKNKKVCQFVLEKTKQLSKKRANLLDNCYLLLSKRKALLAKRKEIMYQSLVLKQKGLEVTTRYQTLLNQFVVYTRKLRELKGLLLLSTEIKAMKKNKEMMNISFTKVKELTANPSSANPAITARLVPNPPKDILNLILLAMKGRENALSLEDTATNLTNSGTKEATRSQADSSSFLILSNLVSNFSRFSPYLANLIENYETNLNELKMALKQTGATLTKIQATLSSYQKLKTSVIQELKEIKAKLNSELSIIRLVKTKLKQFLAQKKLLQFLPRLSNLSTPSFSIKIREAVKLLMQNIVDPKLKYPVDNIYEDKLSNNPKKVIAARKKKWQRLEKYFGGIANMTKMSQSQISKNIAIVIGQREEMNAVRECKKLGIKMFNIIDTNCNPTLADHVIPANDDSRNSIKFVLNKFLVRIRLAQKLRKKYNQKALKKNKSVLNPKYNAPKPFKKNGTRVKGGSTNSSAGKKN
jgi:ribosomal protein S2